MALSVDEKSARVVPGQSDSAERGVANPEFAPRKIASPAATDKADVPVAPDIFRKFGLVPSQKGGRCPGGYEVGRYCSTHVDDFRPGAAESGTTTSDATKQLSASTSGATTSVANIPEPPTRSVTCQTGVNNGTSGVRVETIYAYSTTGVNNQASMVPFIRKVMGDTEYEFFADGVGNPHSRRIRWVTTAPCTLKVSVIGLPASAFTNASTLASALESAGFASNERIYAVFSQESGAGCQAFTPNSVTDANPDVTRTGNPGNGTGPDFWAFTSPSCGYFDSWNPGDGIYTMTHELIHALGAVNIVPGGHYYGAHCTDDWDPVCYGGWPGGTYTCSTAESNRPDCNDDDYFLTLPGPYQWLSVYWNAANNRALYRPPCTATGNGAYDICGIGRRSAGGNVTGSAATDIVDLVDVGSGAASIRILRGNLNGGYDSTMLLVTPQNLVYDWDWDRTQLLVGNINGDSYDDIVLVNDRGGHQLRVIASLGSSGTPAAPQTPPSATWFNWYTPPPAWTLYWPMDWSKFALADHDGDGKADLIALNGIPQASGLYAYEVWTFNSTGTNFAWPTQRFSSANSPNDYDWAGLQMAAADITGDGRAEVVFTASGNGGSTRVRVLLGQASGTFTGPLSCTLESCGNLPQVPANLLITLDDVTADGKADLVVVQKNGWWSTVVARKGQASGTFATLTNGTRLLEGFEFDKIKITTGDATANNYADLMIAYNYDDVGMWRLDGLSNGITEEAYIMSPNMYAPSVWKWNRTKVS